MNLKLLGEIMKNQNSPLDSTLDPGASVAKSFFLGNIVEGNIYPFPAIRESERETLALVLESIERFLSAEQGRFREYDEKGAFPDAYIQNLKELGLFGLIIPEEYGGVGLSNLGYAAILLRNDESEK